MVARVSRRAFVTGTLAVPFLGLALPPVWSQPDPSCASCNSVTPQGLMFDSDFPNSGFSRYPVRAPESIKEGVDFGLQNDPVNPARRVAWFDSGRGTTLGNEFPRVGIDTPAFILPAAHGNTNDVYWMGMSFYYPSSSALTAMDGWCTLSTGGFGQPWGGPSPTGIAIVRDEDNGGKHVLQIGADWTLRAPFEFDRWINLVLGYKFAYNGWIELYLSTGAGNTALRQIPLRGQLRLPHDTMRRGCNDAWYTDENAVACSTGVGVYGSQKLRALYAVQKVGRQKADVLPF